MEEYYIQDTNIHNVKIGMYARLLIEKQTLEYGNVEAIRILENAKSLFITSLQLEGKIKNLLLVGRVQSGKTSCLEMFTAIAFDNGYNSVIIYGGYDTVLLEQTTKRFSKSFDVDDESLVRVFSTSEKERLLNIDQDIIDTIFDNKDGKIIFVSMKRPSALKKINDVLEIIDSRSLKVFIIDDEGDQASLNTEYKKLKTSPTYDEIVKMKNTLQNPLYLSVTATPQALIFSPELSALRPVDARLIHPGNKYTGADSFHIIEGNIVRVEDEIDIVRQNKLPPTLKTAINYYIIASAIMKLHGIKQSDMIIHTSKETKIHSAIATNVDTYISNFRYLIDKNGNDLSTRKNEFLNLFNNKHYFRLELKETNSFEDIWREACIIVHKIFIILQNSQGKITMANKELRPYKIFIGGDLLQRGITFRKLVTTYFTRWPKSTGNMDTTLQRARWFGYRFEYIDLCKIFCTNDIALKFSRLSEVDNDLWYQFESVEKQELKLDDILIDENETGLNPARANVISVKCFSFRRKWINQVTAAYNIDEIEYNKTELFHRIIDKYTFSPMYEGRTDGTVSAWYSEISKTDLIDFIKGQRTIFSIKPLNSTEIEKVIANEKIIIELFWNPLEQRNYRARKRSFSGDMKVSALQQGADTTDESKRHYLGDSFVIKDEDAITIQVFPILPIINEFEDHDRFQYMYSFHFPNPGKAFKWKK